MSFSQIKCTLQLKYPDLVKIDVNELANVSPEYAYDICTNHIRSFSGETADIFQCWSKKLMPFYAIDKFNAGQLNAIFYLFDTYINTIIDSLLNKTNENKNILSIIMTYIRDWNDLVSWIRSSSIDFDLENVGLILDYGMQTLQKYFIFGLKSTHLQSEINNLELIPSISEECLAVLKIMLVQISKYSEMFAIKGDYLDITIKLILSLCTVGELVAFVDIKATAETWKCISKLSSDNAGVIRSNEVFHKNTNWLERPSKFLSNEIKKNILAMHNPKILNQPIDAIERVFKINAFYLKLLSKFVADYPHDLLGSCGEIIELITIVFEKPSFLLDTQICILIEKYFYEGFSKIIGNIFEHREFTKALTKVFQSTQYYEGSLIITVEWLKHLIEEDGKKKYNTFIAHNGEQVINELFKHMAKNQSVFVTNSTYNYCVQYMSTFMLANMENTNIIHIMETQIYQGILQSDSRIMADISMNTLLVVARFANPMYRQKQYEFWLKCVQQHSIYSLEYSVLPELLRSLFNILQNNYKLNILSNFDISKKCDENKFLMLIVGIDQLELEVAKKQLMINKLSIEIFRIFENDLGNLTTQMYYELVLNIKILSKTSEIGNSSLCEPIFSLLYSLLESNLYIDLELLTLSLLQYVISHHMKFDIDHLLKLFNIINQSEKVFLGSISFVLINLCEKLRSNTNYSTAAENSLNKLHVNVNSSENVYLKTIRFRKNQDEMPYINIENDIRKNIATNLKDHSCEKKINRELDLETIYPNSKRTKLEIDYLLNSIYKHTESLYTFSDNKKFNPEQIRKVKEVAEMLTSILAK